MYNSTQHHTTGSFTYYLLFAREPRLWIYVLLSSPKTTEVNTFTGYIEALHGRLRYAYQVVQGEASKKWYAKKVRDATLQPGDQVLLRPVGLQGKNKLADRWHEEAMWSFHSPVSWFLFSVFVAWRARLKWRLCIGICFNLWGLFPTVYLANPNLCIEIPGWWPSLAVDSDMKIPWLFSWVHAFTQYHIYCSSSASDQCGNLD